MIITRRPVHVIDGVQGQDVSQLANVHYSPGPVHEPMPFTAEVDLSPRGHPIHPPQFKEHQAKPYFGPHNKPGLDFGNKFVGSLHHTPMKYDLPPYAPPIAHGRSYGSPNLPFISYGFKPVASPYGNITHPNGLTNRRYAKEIPDHVLEALEEMYARNNYKREIGTTQTRKRTRREVETAPLETLKTNVTENNSTTNATKGHGPSSAASWTVRDALIASTFDLMTGIVDLGGDLLHRVRTTVDKTVKKPTRVNFVPLNSTKASFKNGTVPEPNDGPRPLLTRKQVIEKRRKVALQATTLIRTILADFSKTMNKRLQSPAQP